MKIQDAAKQLGVSVPALEGKMAFYKMTENDLNSATLGDLAQEFKVGAAIQPTGTAAPATPAPKPAPTPAPTSAPAPTQPVPKTPAPVSIADVKAQMQAAAVRAATTSERSQTRIFTMVADKLEAELAATEEAAAQALVDQWLTQNDQDLGKLTGRLNLHRQNATQATLRLLGADDAIEVFALPAGV